MREGGKEEGGNGKGKRKWKEEGEGRRKGRRRDAGREEERETPLCGTVILALGREKQENIIVHLFDMHN